jgi:D-alanine transaminase
LTLCSLNGVLQPIEEARIHPLDRGFLFGDAVYEVVKVERATLLHLTPHLERLGSGLRRLGIRIPPDLERLSTELVEARELDTGSLYLQVSRGVAPRSHLPPKGLDPTVLLLAFEHDHFGPAKRFHRVITVPDGRWSHCDLKTTSLMATVLAKLATRDAGAQEVLFVSEKGEIREGGSSNFFARRRDRLETHPLDGRILPGVTRSLVLRLCAEEGLPVVERAPRLERREEWQEAFLCGTLTGVQPVVAMDREPVPPSGSGEWTQRIAEALADYEARLLPAGDRG